MRLKSLEDPAFFVYNVYALRITQFEKGKQEYARSGNENMKKSNQTWEYLDSYDNEINRAKKLLRFCEANKYCVAGG